LKTTFLIATGDDPEADTQLDALAAAPTPSRKTPPASTAAKGEAKPAASRPAPADKPTPPPPTPPAAPNPAENGAAEPTLDQLNQLADIMKERGLDKAAIKALMQKEFAWTVESPRELDRDQFALLLQWFAKH